MELTLEALLKQARGNCKNHLNAYKKALENDTQAALIKVLVLAIEDSQVSFRKGLGVSDPKILAQWASEWSNYDLMLSEFMLSVPSILLKQGLMKTCIEMTDNLDLLTIFATRCILENEPRKLEALYGAGYTPVFNAHDVGDFLRVVQDVSLLKRELFTPFIDAAIDTINQSKLMSSEYLMAMVGRYLGCRGGAGATYQSFKHDLWPKLMEIKSLGVKNGDMHASIQCAVSLYTTKKTANILKLLASDCRKDPFIIIEKGCHGHVRGRSTQGTHNPYSNHEVASHIPVEILLAPAFFTMINNNSMNEDFMCYTLPRLLDSKLNYQDDPGYQEIRDRAASFSVVEAMSDCPTLAEKSAVLHIMTLDNERFDSLFSQKNGKAALYIFEDRLPHYLEASDRKPYSTAQYFSELSGCSFAEIESDMIYLQAAKGLGNEIMEEINRFTHNLVEYGNSFDKAREYLESLGALSDKIALDHCKALARNSVCPEGDPEKLLRMITWKNESIIEDALSEDLGL
jgi:hypothetical protein